MQDLEKTDEPKSVNVNTVELVYDGEVVDTLELPADIPEEVKTKIKQGMEKGLLYNKKMHDIAKNEKDAAEWRKLQGLAVDVKLGKVDPAQIVEQFKEIGIDLNKKEKKQVEDEDYDLMDDKVQSKIAELETKLKSFEQREQERKASELASEMDSAHSQYKGKYDGKNGWPKYDPKDIDKFIEENNFYMPDVRKNFEAAYFEMNKDAILKAEQEKAMSLKSEKSNKSTFVERGDHAIDFSNKKMDFKGKNWSEVALEAANLIDEKDLFEED